MLVLGANHRLRMGMGIKRGARDSGCGAEATHLKERVARVENMMCCKNAGA